MIKNILLILCVYLTASNCEILKNKCISARNLNPGILSHQYLTKGLNGYCQESYSNNVIGGDGSLFYDKLLEAILIKDVFFIIQVDHIKVIILILIINLVWIMKQLDINGYVDRLKEDFILL